MSNLLFPGMDISIDDFRSLEEETPVMGSKEPYKKPANRFQMESINRKNKETGPCYLCNMVTKNHLNHYDGTSTRICLDCISQHLSLFQS